MTRMTRAVAGALVLAWVAGTARVAGDVPPPPMPTFVVHFEAGTAATYGVPATIPVVVHAYISNDTTRSVSSVNLYTGYSCSSTNWIGAAVKRTDGSDYFDFTWKNVAAGSYTLFAVATSGADRSPVSLPPLAFTVALPTDLTVSMLKVTPAKPLDDTPFTAAVTVKNMGKNASAGGTLTLTPAVDAAGIAQTVPAIAKSKSVTLTFTVPGQTPGAKKMTTTLSAVPGETKTTNNSKAVTYTVTARPDFSITAVAFSKFPPLCKSNSKFTAYVTVLNAGGAAKAGYLDVWINYADGQAFTKRVVVSTIPAGKTKRVTLSGLLTGVATGEPRTFRAVVDSLDTAHESNEDNNVFTTTYTPCASTPSSAP